MTRLSFNEQGLITYHHDVWDIKDVLRLIPGVRIALWVSARAAGWGLACIGRRWLQELHNPHAYSNAGVPNAKFVAEGDQKRDHIFTSAV